MGVFGNGIKSCMSKKLSMGFSLKLAMARCLYDRYSMQRPKLTFTFTRIAVKRRAENRECGIP